MEHVHASDHERDSRKSHGEEGEHRQQFPSEIRLQRKKRYQEHPHPLPASVFGLHFLSGPDYHSDQPSR
jgi:hypothetical protein